MPTVLVVAVAGLAVRVTTPAEVGLSLAVEVEASGAAVLAALVDRLAESG